jgi:hypothetical protein
MRRRRLISDNNSQIKQDDVVMQDFLWLLFSSLLGVIAMTPFVDRFAVPQIESKEPKSVAAAEYDNFCKVALPDGVYALVEGTQYGSAIDIVRAVTNQGESVVLQVAPARRFEEVMELKTKLQGMGKKVYFEFQKK